TQHGAAAAATESPPEPAPITQRSGVRVSVIATRGTAERGAGSNLFAFAARRDQAREARRVCPQWNAGAPIKGWRRGRAGGAVRSAAMRSIPVPQNRPEAAGGAPPPCPKRAGRRGFPPPRRGGNPPRPPAS